MSDAMSCSKFTQEQIRKGQDIVNNFETGTINSKQMFQQLSDLLQPYQHHGGTKCQGGGIVERIRQFLGCIGRDDVLPLEFIQPTAGPGPAGPGPRPRPRLPNHTNRNRNRVAPVQPALLHLSQTPYHYPASTHPHPPSRPSQTPYRYPASTHPHPRSRPSQTPYRDPASSSSALPRYRLPPKTTRNRSSASASSPSTMEDFPFVDWDKWYIKGDKPNEWYKCYDVQKEIIAENLEKIFEEYGDTYNNGNVVETLDLRSKLEKFKLECTTNQHFIFDHSISEYKYLTYYSKIHGNDLIIFKLFMNNWQNPDKSFNLYIKFKDTYRQIIYTDFEFSDPEQVRFVTTSIQKMSNQVRELIEQIDKWEKPGRTGQGGGVKRKNLDTCTVKELTEKARRRRIKVTGLTKKEIIAKLRKR